jgi:hypothetical protein
VSAHEQMDTDQRCVVHHIPMCTICAPWLRHWVTVEKITRSDGVAGQYALTVDVTYHHGPDPVDDDPTTTTFVSSVYWAPVVMVLSNGAQVLVEDWRRYGEQLDQAWVRSFYGVST